MACGGSETRTQGGGSAPPSTAEESYPRATEVPAVLECVAGHALAPAWREAQPWQRPSGGARACAAGGGGAKSARVRRVMSAKTSGERNNSRQTPQAPLAPPSVLAGSPPIEHHHHHHRHCSLVWFIWLQLVWFGFNTHCQLLIISLFCYLLAKLFETCPPRSPWKQRTRASAITTRTRTRTGSRMCNKLQVRNLQ